MTNFPLRPWRLTHVPPKQIHVSLGAIGSAGLTSLQPWTCTKMTTAPPMDSANVSSMSGRWN